MSRKYQIAYWNRATQQGGTLPGTYDSFHEAQREKQKVQRKDTETLYWVETIEEGERYEDK